MKIACDVDGVICKTIFLMEEEIIKCGYCVKFNRYNPEIDGVENYDDFIHEIVDHIFTEHILEIKPYADALLFIPLIFKDLGSITFITARRKEFHDDTLTWLRQHFPISFAFIGRSSSEKGPFLIENNYDVLIEDRLRTANHATELGLKTYLVNRPWNTGREAIKGVERINNLGEFYMRELNNVKQ